MTSVVKTSVLYRLVERLDAASMYHSLPHSRFTDVELYYKYAVLKILWSHSDLLKILDNYHYVFSDKEYNWQTIAKEMVQCQIQFHKANKEE